MKPIKFISENEEETRKIARKLARGLKAQDCLALVGDLGSGKTTFVKGLALGFMGGKKDYVCSPTFVILKIYRGRLPIYHFDLYRLRGFKDFQDAGLDEFMEAGGVSVIEWADKIRAFLPVGHLRIKFSSCGPQARVLMFSTSSLRLQRLLRRILV